MYSMSTVNGSCLSTPVRVRVNRRTTMNKSTDIPSLVANFVQPWSRAWMLRVCANSVDSGALWSRACLLSPTMDTTGADGHPVHSVPQALPPVFDPSGKKGTCCHHGRPIACTKVPGSWMRYFALPPQMQAPMGAVQTFALFALGHVHPCPHRWVFVTGRGCDRGGDASGQFDSCSHYWCW